MSSRGALVRVIILGSLGGLYWIGYALSIFEYSDLAISVPRFGVPFYVAFWAQADSRSSRYWPAFHYAWYLVGLWPITVPHYVLHTRGRRGLPLLFLLVLLLMHNVWGYWLGIFAGWSLGWYSTDAIRELWRGAA
jgi:hypothetical protein